MELFKFRYLNFIDKLIIEFDIALKVITGSVSQNRSYPDNMSESDCLLTNNEKSLSSSIMRINHTGEICAQALYRGQAFLCKDEEKASIFLNASYEEIDHLVWCRQRIIDLNGNESIFNGLWYISSFLLGLSISCLDISYNLGFMAETEKQVEIHLDKYIKLLPINDLISKNILIQMKIDETKHKNTAKEFGGIELPWVFTKCMYYSSKLMTIIVYKL